MDEFQQKIAAMSQAHQQQRQADWAEVFGAETAVDLNQPTPPLPDLTNLPVEEAILAYDGWATQILARRRQAFIADRLAEPAPASTPPTAAPPTADRPAAAALNRQPPTAQLTGLDELVERLFDLRRIFPDIRHNTDVYFCRTVAEFVQPLAAINLSAAEREQLIRQGEQGQMSGPVLGYDAYYLPDQGCYVNGPLLAGGSAPAEPDQLLADSDLFYRAARAVVQTMWGWGFLLDYSLAGQERKQLGLWPNEVAAQLGLSARTAVPFQNNVNAARYYASLSEAGWSAWIVETVLQAARRKQIGGSEQTPFTLSNLWHIFKRLITDVDQPISEIFLPILNIIHETMMTNETGLRLVHGHINNLRELSRQYDQPFIAKTGWSCAAWLSRTMLNHVEARVGSFCLPYALLISGHVNYDLARVAPVTLHNDLQTIPRASLDTRLWMLSSLEEYVKYNVTSVANAAWDRLHLEGPQELRGS